MVLAQSGDVAAVTSGLDIGALSSWIAAAISVTALLVTLWLRVRDRPSPAWTLVRSGIAGNMQLHQALHVVSDGLNPQAAAGIGLTNDGDGVANRVRVSSEDTKCIIFVIMDANDERGWRLSDTV